MYGWDLKLALANGTAIASVGKQNLIHCLITGGVGTYNQDRWPCYGKVDQRHADRAGSEAPQVEDSCANKCGGETNRRISWILKKQLALFFCFRLLRFGMGFMATYLTQDFQTVFSLKQALKWTCFLKLTRSQGSPPDPYPVWMLVTLKLISFLQK